MTGNTHRLRRTRCGAHENLWELDKKARRSHACEPRGDAIALSRFIVGSFIEAHSRRARPAVHEVARSLDSEIGWSGEESPRVARSPHIPSSAERQRTPAMPRAIHRGRVRLQSYVDPPLADRVDHFCAAMGMSESALVKAALNQYLD